MVIRAVEDADRERVRVLVVEHWGGPTVVSRERVHTPDALPGLIAEADGSIAGLATFRIDGPECELVTLNAFAAGEGCGTLLVEGVADAARRAGCQRLWLITTNDNTGALRFYQKRGFRLVAVHRDAIAGSRMLKPQIPLMGLDGIPIRDEIELELMLDTGD